jgi:hypothetical protein
MADRLDYILHCIKQPNVEPICQQSSCEILPCNCITGIVVNYAAYVALNCFSTSAYTAKIQSAWIDNSYIYYVVCRKRLWGHLNGVAVCPVLRPPNLATPDAVPVIPLCSESRGAQAYVKFLSDNESGSLKGQVAFGIRSLFSGVKYSAEQSTVKFWIHFLTMVRVQPLKIASKALLFMAIYIFPTQTLSLMLSSGYVFAPHFIESYLNFLLNIGDSDRSDFLQRFASAFQAETDLDISKYVDNMSNLPSLTDTFGESKKELFRSAMIASHTKNIASVTEPSGFLRKLCLESADENLRSMPDKFPPVRDCG